MTITHEPATLTDEQRAWIEGLRAVADWYEQHPTYADGIGEDFLICIPSWEDDVAEQMATAARALGRADKEVTEKYFMLRRRFGPHSIQAYSHRDAVCERVVVGTETVEVEEPDPEALAALPKVKRAETREVVEWRCPDSILRP